MCFDWLTKEYICRMCFDWLTKGGIFVERVLI